MSMLSVDYIHSTIMASMQICMALKPFCMRGLQQAYCSPRRSLRCLCSWGRPRRSFAHTFSKPAAIQSSLVCTSCHSWLALLLLVVCTSCHSCHRPLEPGCAHCRMRHFTTVAGYACSAPSSTAAACKGCARRAETTPHQQQKAQVNHYERSAPELSPAGTLRTFPMRHGAGRRARPESKQGKQGLFSFP